MIVPVYLHHQSNPDLQVMVYALLDPASIREDIVGELQVDGVKTQLQLNTMHGTEVIPTRKVECLFVSRVDKGFQIKLPKAFTGEEIPSKRDEIPRPESAAEWPHLHRIASKIHLMQSSQRRLCPEKQRPLCHPNRAWVGHRTNHARTSGTFPEYLL